ncbi:MAG TPA: hypothetical protein VK421_03575 [Pyrinomonadaceae bacterium]|nr:hypothetical protein [Pyrinomonadaceae bacterium]
MFTRTTLRAVITAALFSLALSTAAQAQWGRNDDYRRDRRDDRYGRYDSRALRDAASRLKDRSKDLERDVDRLLDRSRYDNTRREDRVNDQVNDFRRMAERFRDRVGDGRDLSRSANEARDLLRQGERVGRLLERMRLDSRTHSDWSQITRDLNLVADIYRLNYRGGYGGGYDPRYPNGRRDDDNWWRRIPDVVRRP